MRCIRYIAFDTETIHFYESQIQGIDPAIPDRRAEWANATACEPVDPLYTGILEAGRAPSPKLGRSNAYRLAESDDAWLNCAE